MRLKFFTIAITALVCVNHQTMAQSGEVANLPLIVPSSPEAANLIRSIQYPVSYANGSVDITIPLYEITLGDVVIPISLSYNHKGVRPHDYTYYLGQGWTLNAEPSISRKINAKPDDNCKYDLPPAEDGLLNGEPHQRTKEELAYDWSRKDAFPDEYYYKIPGKSGAFMFKNSFPAYEAATFPFEPIQVGYTSGNQGSFVVTDDNGVRYEFGTTEQTEISEITGNFVPTSWKCDRIVTPKGNITFDYTSSQTIKSMSIGEYMILEDVKNVNDNRPDLPILQKYDNSSPLSSSFRYYRLVRRISPDGSERDSYEFEAGNSSPNGQDRVKLYDVQSQRIEKISFPGGYVSFTMSESNKTLAAVNVCTASGETIRSISLEHSSISSEDSHPVLNSVTITGGGIDEKYTLEYLGNLPHYENSSSQPVTPLPVNFWGYYTSEAGGYVHNHNVKINHQREEGFASDQTFMLGTGNRMLPVESTGILKCIATKSGSRTEFLYESDNFKMGSSEFQDYKYYSTGGLRIKRITQRDDFGSPVTERHFEYGEGIPRINITPEYYTTTKEYILKYSDQEDKQWRQRIFSANLRGDITTSGVPIVYSSVSETTKGYVDGMLRNFGKTVYTYQYTQPGTPYMDLESGLICDSKESDWMRGKLLSQKVYRWDNEAEEFSMVQRSDYVYLGIRKDTIIAGQVYIPKTTITPSTNTIVDEIEYRTHNMYTGRELLASQTDSLYTDDGKVITKRINFSYDNDDHMYPTVITTTRSDGLQQKQLLKYPLDVTGITNIEHTNAVGVMKSKNILKPVIEQTDMVGEGALRTTYNLYTSDSGKTPSGWPSPHKLEIKDGGMISPEERIVFHKYDNKSNPVYATKDSITKVVYLWGYNGRQNLVAVIENADYNQVKNGLAGIGPEAVTIEESNYDTVINSLRSTPYMAGSFITSFKYKPLVGIVEITDPRGVTVFYEYDSLERLSTISDENLNPTHRYQYNIRSNQ